MARKKERSILNRRNLLTRAPQGQALGDTCSLLGADRKKHDVKIGEEGFRGSETTQHSVTGTPAQRRPSPGSLLPSMRLIK